LPNCWIPIPGRGLDPFTLAERQSHFGPHLLSARQGRGPLVRFLLQFHQPLIYTLLAAALVTGIFDQSALTGESIHSAPIGLDSWLRVLGAGLIVYAAGGWEKSLVERWSSHAT
jgi:Ca2+-transporting ATPase